jgi:hypothetical protein
MKQLAIALLFLSSLVTNAQDLQQGLLVEYNFDGNTNDTSGNQYNGTPFNLAYGPDRFGNPTGAAYFNGTDAYMNFPNLAALKPDLPMTFSFYVKYASTDFHHQVVFNTSFENNHCTGVWFNSSSANNSHAINFGDGDFAYSPATRRTFLCVKPIVVNVWYHVVVVMNSASDMKIYFDCVNITQGSYSGSGGSLVYSDTPGCIGRHDRDLSAPADYLEGYIDEFRYWNRALTDDELALLCVPMATSQFTKAAAGLTLYPNPTSDKFHIQTDLKTVGSLAVYNALGQQMYVGDFLQEIDVAHFVPGIYFVTVKGDGVSHTQKIIVGH